MERVKSGIDDRWRLDVEMVVSLQATEQRLSERLALSQRIVQRKG